MISWTKISLNFYSLETVDFIQLRSVKLKSVIAVDYTRLISDFLFKLEVKVIIVKVYFQQTKERY